MENHSFFYLGSPQNLLFTLLGMDGYFFYRFKTYYILGEWFLGAIVMLYVLYPLFLKGVERFRWKVLLVLIPVWIFQIEYSGFEILTQRNLIYCSGMFILGMLCFQYKLYKKRYLKATAGMFVMILLLVPICQNVYLEILFCVAAFFAFFAIGEVVMKIPVLNGIVKSIADISFPIFLVQNVVIVSVVSSFLITTTAGVIKVLAFSVLLCLLYGWCLKAIVEALYKTRWFICVNNFFDRK